MRNYWVDVLMALLALTVGVSALLLWVVLPQGYFATRLFWVTVHKWAGLALSLAVVLHVLLHWRWLVRTTGQLLDTRSPPDVVDPRRRREDPGRM